jgi:hypothetical protein
MLTLGQPVFWTAMSLDSFTKISWIILPEISYLTEIRLGDTIEFFDLI